MCASRSATPLILALAFALGWPWLSPGDLPAATVLDPPTPAPPTLQSLFDGQTITIGNVIFADWELSELYPHDPETRPDLTQVRIVPLDDRPDRPGFSVDDPSGQLATTGPDLISLDFGFSVSRLDGKPTIGGVSAGLDAYQFGGDGGLIQVGQGLFDASLSYLDTAFLEADRRSGFVQLSDEIEFDPQASLYAETSVFLAGDYPDDSVAISSLSLRYPLVPEPSTLRTINSGTWNAGSTWDAGIAPTKYHDVEVLSHEVVAAASGDARSLLIDHSEGAVVIDPRKVITAVNGAQVVAGTLDIASASLLEVGTDFILQAASTYLCKTNGSYNGLVYAAGDVVLHAGSTLSLQATANFNSVGERTLSIITAGGGVTGTFTNEPAQGEHLGYGVFHQSVDYDANTVDVNVFQAIAGDANGDQAFNFSDLVQTFSASGAVYGNPSPPTAVDWPGGDFTDDQAFTFADLVKAFGDAGAHYGAASYPAAGLAGPQGGAVSLVYDQATGQLSIDAGDLELVALSIESAGGLLEITPEADALLDGFADIANSGQFAKLDLSGMSSLEFGAAVSAMLSESDLLADLTVTGALLGGGTIEDVSLAVTAVPEPGTMLLLLSGLAGLLLWWRLRRVQGATPPIRQRSCFS